MFAFQSVSKPQEKKQKELLDIHQKLDAKSAELATVQKQLQTAESSIATLEKEKQILKESEGELRTIINQSVAEHKADVGFARIVLWQNEMMQKVVSLEKERVWAFGFLITNRMIICPSWQR